MTLIVPAILEKTEKDFKEKIQNAEMRSLANIWQIDVLDGSMFNADSWADASKLQELDPPHIELHLMIDDPLPVIEEWTSHVPNVIRAIIHAEIPQDLRSTIDTIHAMGIDAGLAINPDTPLDAVYELHESIDMLLIMGVQPGFSGQRFLGDQILEKIKEAKNSFLAIQVAVDGGVKETNAERIIDAGADQLCIASGIWDSISPAKAYKMYSNL